MKSDFEIAKCGPESREEALGLLSRLWTSDLDVNRRCWTWKYDRNPAAAGQRVYLALERGRVVGMRGFNGALWEVDPSDGPVWAPCAGDTVVARQCESRGVFRAIMDVAQAELHAEGHPFMFNLTAGPTIFLRSLRGGWRPVPGTYERWARPGNREKRTGEDPFAPLGGDGGANGAQDNCGTTVSDQPRAEQMAALVRRVPPSGRIRRVRDAAYFAWRFENPLARYRFLYRTAGEELDGYVVVRAGRYRATDRVAILDAEAVSPTGLAELLDTTVRMFGDWGLALWVDSLGPGIRSHLRAAGFAPPRATRPIPRHRNALLVKATDPHLPAEQWRLGSRSVLDAANWDLRMMWSDGA